MRLVSIMGNVFRDSNLGAIWRDVPKLDVAGSIPVSRSSLSNHLETSPNRLAPIWLHLHYSEGRLEFVERLADRAHRSVARLMERRGLGPDQKPDSRRGSFNLLPSLARV